ncbi:MAG: hypothetical protein AAF601_14115 [Pseudomonadota bacterium]
MSIWIGLAAMWAGVSLAGNLIAAPAKFTVEALTLPVALQVGRAQFTWIGYVEWVLLALFLLSWLAHVCRPPALLSIAALVFGAQQLWLQPMLEARSDLIIAGNAVPESAWHLVFAVLETIKCALLACFAGHGLWRMSQTLSQSD